MIAVVLRLISKDRRGQAQTVLNRSVCEAEDRSVGGRKGERSAGTGPKKK